MVLLKSSNRCFCIAPVTDKVENADRINDYIQQRLSCGASFLDDLQKAVPEGTDLETARALIGSTHVCRTGPCLSGGVTCCGMCTRKCPNRCVQDLIHKFCSYIYMGGTDGRYVSKLLKQPEKLTYDILLETLKWADTRYSLSYEPLPVLYKHPRTGKTHRQVDSSTGNIIFRDWPESGLCPFCIPQVTTLRRHLYHSRAISHKQR